MHLFSRRFELATIHTTYNTKSCNTLRGTTTLDAALSLARYQSTRTFATFGLVHEVLEGKPLDAPIRPLARGTGPAGLESVFLDLLGPNIPSVDSRDVLAALNAYVLPTVPQAHHYADRMGIHEWEAGIQTVVRDCPNFATDETEIANFRDDHPFVEDMWGWDDVTAVLSTLKSTAVGTKKAAASLWSATVAAKTLWGAYKDWKAQHGNTEDPITSKQYSTLAENLIAFFGYLANTTALQLKNEGDTDTNTEMVDDTTWRRVVVDAFLVAIGARVALTGDRDRSNNRWQMRTLGPERTA